MDPEEYEGESLDKSVTRTATSSLLSCFGCTPPSPSHGPMHGFLDHYGPFPPSLPHDFASEVGPEHDTLSAFSNPEMMPSSAFHGDTRATVVTSSSVPVPTGSPSQ